MMKDNLFKSGLIALLDCTFSLLINEFHKQNGRCNWSTRSSKSLNKFSINKTKKYGRQGKCKICTRKYHNEVWYPKRKVKRAKHINLRKKELKKKNYLRIVKNYFAKGCVDCGEKDSRVLEFDHVRGIKKKLEGRRGVMGLVSQGYTWKTIKKEIDKCEVRCRNCHKIRTYKQFNYYSEIKDEIRKIEKG